MPVSIVIGGQFGSEGKGKVSHFFSNKLKAKAVVRVGGSNSGHTVIGHDGKEYVFRILPTSSIDADKLSVLPSGSYIDLDLLFAELAISKIPDENCKIDPSAVIIDKSMKSAEQASSLHDTIGSTQSGTGEAVIRRLRREPDKITFAKDEPKLQRFICNTKPLLRKLLNSGEHVVIEGTQGFGLSPINAPFYPHCTSRDTTAAGFLMETGLSPFDVENVIMVIRAFPIRVAGNSGPLENEINWETITRTSGSSGDLTEYTSATKRIRRIAEFDAGIVKLAIEVNKPNIIVMNHLDYVDFSCHDLQDLSTAAMDYLNQAESDIGQSIGYYGTGKSAVFYK